jgi:hypothetical protein
MLYRKTSAKFRIHSNFRDIKAIPYSVNTERTELRDVPLRNTFFGPARLISPV